MVESSQYYSAKAGEFDEKCFINSRSGRFQFPNYKHDKRYAIHIKDLTDYKTTYNWDKFTASERKQYNIEQFEVNFAKPKLAVEPFATLFDHMHLKDMAPMEYLKNHGAGLEKILTSKFVINTDDRLFPFLLDDGYLEPYEFADSHEYRTFLEQIPLRTLRAACKMARIPTKLKSKLLQKQKQIDFIILSKRTLSFPKALKQTASLQALLCQFYDVYIQEIKRNASRFHPLYIPYIWEAALSVNNSDIHPQLNEKIKLVIDSKYWHSGLIAKIRISN